MGSSRLLGYQIQLLQERREAPLKAIYGIHHRLGES
jgi:hypothetical protein